MSQQSIDTLHRIEPRQFRRLLNWVIAPPLILMVLLAGVLLWQVENLLRSTRMVDHSDQIISDAHAVMASMLNMETGQRGFMITGQQEFLEPYDAGNKAIDNRIAGLRQLIQGDAAQTNRLDAIKQSTSSWREFAAGTIAQRSAGHLAGIAAGDLTGKQIMDTIRAQLGVLIASEEQLRNERSQHTRQAVLATVITSGGLTLLLGVVLAFNARRQFIAMAKTYSDALAVAAEEAAARREGEKNLQQMAVARERYAQQLQELAKASISVNASLSIEEAIRLVTEFARQIIAAHQGVTSLTLNQDWAQAINSISLSEKYNAYRDYMNEPTGEGIYSLICKTNKPMRLTQAELEAHPAFRNFGKDAAKHPPMRGWLAAPLIGRDGVNIGVIQLSDKNEGDFNADDEAILVQLAQMASIAIENGRFFKGTQEARLDAERANRLKDQFLATLSHELRTPLNAILGWAQLLRSSNPASEDWTQGLDTIERNARAQTQLVEDLLDVSRIISGKLRLDVQSVNLPETIIAGINAVQPAADAKSIRIERILDPSAGPVTGDPARLQQIFWNLLSNAVKFTPKKGKVYVKLARVNSHVEVSVTDSGEGISPEFLPHLFHRFSQADSTTTRRHGGLGLGLSIVKHLVEMHGGSIHADSPGRGKGATFVVSLPIAVAHEPTQQRDHPTSSIRYASLENTPNLDGLRVLVVDDESDARDLIRRILGMGKAEVVAVGSAKEAMAMIQPFQPQVLISDIGMPGLDGYEFIRQVRATGKSSQEVPAVALTAFARTEDRRRALMAGFQMHVAKPVDPGELLAVVASLAGRTDASSPA
jgi:signal transduction histidine kinase/CHASE3 domain sensor protein/ActR/RegA family two-component response regulator